MRTAPIAAQAESLAIGSGLDVWWDIHDFDDAVVAGHPSSLLCLLWVLCPSSGYSPGVLQAPHDGQRPFFVDGDGQQVAAFVG